MPINEILAQIFALMGLGSNIASVQSDKRRWVLVFQVLANLLYGIQYIFLNAWPALGVSVISAVECIIVYYHAKRHAGGNDRISLPILILIVVAIIIVSLLTYTDIYSLIPAVATITYTIIIWQPNLLVFRLASAFISACWFVYNLRARAWVSVATSVVEFVSAVVAVTRLDILANRRLVKKSTDNN